MTTHPSPHETATEAIGWSAQTRDLTYAYPRQRGSSTALSSLTAQIRPGTITGLLGRNGSGKSTFARILAGHVRSTAGEVLVDGAAPYEDARRMAGVALVAAGPGSHGTRIYAGYRLRVILDQWCSARPTWNQRLAEQLMEQWGLNPDRDIPEKLSQGQLSSVSALLGLASGAPLTIFDEVHLGMDAVMRRQFYDALLAEYAATGRTIILSSHLIEEISDLLEDVLLLDRGTVLASGAADDVRAAHRPVPEAPLPTLTDVLISLTEAQS